MSSQMDAGSDKNTLAQVPMPARTLAMAFWSNLDSHVRPCKAGCAATHGYVALRVLFNSSLSICEITCHRIGNPGVDSQHVLSFETQHLSLWRFRTLLCTLVLSTSSCQGSKRKHSRPVCRPLLVVLDSGRSADHWYHHVQHCSCLGPSIPGR